MPWLLAKSNPFVCNREKGRRKVVVINPAARRRADPLSSVAVFYPAFEQRLPCVYRLNYPLNKSSRGFTHALVVKVFRVAALWSRQAYLPL